MTAQARAAAGLEPRVRRVKCLVWDLDHTLWDGILLEDPEVRVRPEARALITTLDARGILHSVASRNDPARAMAALERAGLAGYFLHPQIGWGAKSAAIARIAGALHIATDAIAFVDDQAFERDEVRSSLPDVLAFGAEELAALAEHPAFQPRFVTEDSRLRRSLYQSDIRRNEAERDFSGPKEEFLASLGMVFRIAPAGPGDLRRAEELTERTNQLNSTGYTYSYEELAGYARSPGHRLLIASLDDRYGSYGRIGLALVECGAAAWTLKLLLMSCRVMSRGVGTILLNHVMGLARCRGVDLRAEFVPNDRNRMMQVTYRFAGFREAERRDGVVILENDLRRIQPAPGYVDLRIAPGADR